MSTLPVRRPPSKPVPPPAVSFSARLTINGTPCDVRPVPGCDPQLVRRAFSLEKVKLAGELADPSRPAHDGYYHVVESARGNVSCDCPDYIFRREGQDPRGCKHVQACQAAGLIPVPRVDGPEPADLKPAASVGLTLAETLRLARRVTGWVVTHPDLDWRGVPADDADMALEAAMERLGLSDHADEWTAERTAAAYERVAVPGDFMVDLADPDDDPAPF
jgi:hypothetical protein